MSRRPPRQIAPDLDSSIALAQREADRGSADRDQLIAQLAAAAETCGAAVQLLARNDHRQLPEDVRRRLTYVRGQLSILNSDLIKLVKEA